MNQAEAKDQSACPRWTRRVALAMLMWILLFLLLYPTSFVQLSLLESVGEKSNHQKSSEERRLILLGLAVPFVAAGLIFYGFLRRQSFPALWHPERLYRSSPLELMIHKLQAKGLMVRAHATDVMVVGVFLLIQLNCFVGHLHVAGSKGKIAKSGFTKCAAKALGYNGLYALIFSIALMDRKSYIPRLLGISSERLTVYHIWCSWFAVGCLMLHGGLYCAKWFEDAELGEKLVPCIDCDEKQRYRIFRNLSGSVALSLLVVLLLSSLETVRRNWFRVFTILHVPVALVMVVMVCLHYDLAAIWFAVPVCAYVMYRLVSLMTRGKASILSASILSDRYIRLDVCRSFVRSAREFEPGQFVYIRMKDSMEWHPFSVSSSALRDEATFQLVVSLRGPFTRQLFQLIQAEKFSDLQVDGFYGDPIPVAGSMVFVAGGVGMAPFLSTLEHFMVLSQRASSSSSAKATMALPHNICVIWAAKDRTLFHAHQDLLAAIQKSSAWTSKVLLYETQSFAPESSSPQPHEVRGSCKWAFSPSALLRKNELQVFAGVCIGGLAALAAVSSSENSICAVWWMCRLSMITSIVCGAAGGGCAVLLLFKWNRRLKGLDTLQQSSIDGSITGKCATPEQGVNEAREDQPEEDADTETLLTNNSTSQWSSQLSGDVAAAASVWSPSSTSSQVAIHSGRPVVAKLMKHIAEENGQLQVRVWTSGPESLLREVARASERFPAGRFVVEAKSFCV